MKVGTLVTPDSQKGKQEHKRRRTKEGKPEKHTMNCRRLILESTMEIIEASGSQPGAVLHHPPKSPWLGHSAKTGDISLYHNWAREAGELSASGGDKPRILLNG